MKKALRLLGILLITVILLLGIVVTGFYVWLNSYIQSDPFRALVSNATSEELHVKGEYLPFHWSGLTVHSDGFFAKGSDSTPVNFVRADQLRADLNLRPVLEGIWKLPQVDIQTVEIELKSPLPPATTATVPNDTASTEAAPTPSALNTFFTQFLPKRVEIDRINVNSVNLSFKPGPPVTLRDLQVTLLPHANTWTIEGSSGKLKHPDWPPFTVDKAKLRATPEQLFLTAVTLQMESNGQIDVSGDVNFRDNAPIQFQADVKHAPITAFLTGDWRARLVGNLNGQVKWSGDLRGPAPVQAKGSLKLLEGRIEALPFLNQIASWTKTEDFRSLKLQKATADFIWDADKNRLEVTNLVLESEGLVRVEGKFAVEKEIIDGQFSIGTVPSVLKFIPGAEAQVFTTKHDSYIWAPLNLTGPVRSPSEDLTPKLKAAAVNSIGETANQGLQDVINAAKSLLPF